MTQTYNRARLWALGMLLVLVLAGLLVRPVSAQHCSASENGSAVAGSAACEPDGASDDRFTDVASASAAQDGIDNDAQNVWTILVALGIVLVLIALVDRSGKRARASIESSGDL